MKDRKQPWIALLFPFFRDCENPGLPTGDRDRRQSGKKTSTDAERTIDPGTRPDDQSRDPAR